MSRSKIIEDAELGLSDDDYQDDVSANTDNDQGGIDCAKTRKRIDELLEKKRLKELLDEDEWEL
ncbi:hypothetical protein [Thalassotalea sp. ND16A]|uniref:hypothetical protein n=1 Tax=Thalassotalea sp. ND16A TaxID=1535422 RepID=UPI00051A3470|nr:hypothetical protein [Thalassotalea sp. ND16A]KGJ89363.1 hypothetical protein ND16A_2256 [Thalassotalea sp. ND16A]